MVPVLLVLHSDQTNNNIMRASIVICIALALAVYVSAHGHLSSPAARTGTKADVHTAFCGGVAKLSTTAATWQAGAQQSVSWNIAVNHVGTISGYIVRSIPKECRVQL